MSLSHGVIAVVRDLLEADNAFFRVAVAMPEPERGRVLAARARTTNNILALMRHIIVPPLSPTRFVVNIPLQTGSHDYEDVAVTPSPAQAAASYELSVPIDDGVCAICQDTMSVGTRLRNCRHAFHHGCITNWFAMSVRCPVCRDDVRVQRATDPHASSASV